MPPCRAGRSRRCSASPSSRRCSTGGPGRSRRSRSGEASAPAASNSTTTMSASTTHRSSSARTAVGRAARRRGVGRARYVVGCDGANSTVRTLLDVAIDDRGFFYDWLIVDVILDEPRVFDPPNLQICDPARPTTAVSGGPGRRRWEFMRLPDEPHRRPEPRVEGMGAAGTVGRAPRQRPPRTARRLYVPGPSPSAVAGRSDLPRRRCRPPDAAVRRPGHVRRDPRRREPRLEARPRARRRAPHPSSSPPTTRSAAECQRGHRLLDRAGQGDLRAGPGRGGGRDEAMAAAYDGGVSEDRACPGSRAASSHAGTPLAGELFPQGDLDGRWFDDVHGVGLAARHRRSGLDRSRSGARRLVRDHRRRRRRTSAASATDLAAWFETHDVRWALQRPDFYLFGTATDLDGAAALLSDLRRQLRPG